MAIKFKGSNISGLIPHPFEIEEREIVINTADRKIFSKSPDGTVIEIGTGNQPSGLEKIIGNGTDQGWRFIDVDIDNYGIIGQNAIDLSINSLSGNYGATAYNSIAIGYNIINDSNETILLGTNSTSTIGINNILFCNDSLNTKNNNIIIGYNNLASEDNTSIFGRNLQATYQDQYIFGNYNNNDSSNFIEIGCGSDSDRKNIFEIKKSGIAKLPLSNTSDIIEDSKNLITVETLELGTSLGIVNTVNGQSGDITLDKTYVGLDNVDNTSDAQKTLSGNPIGDLIITNINNIGDMNLDTSATNLTDAVNEIYNDTNIAKVNNVNTFTAAQRGSISTLTFSQNIAINMDESNRFKCLLTDNTTIENPQNLQEGQSGILYFEQDTTGGRSVTFGTYWKFINEHTPFTDANKINVYSYEVYNQFTIILSYIGAI